MIDYSYKLQTSSISLARPCVSIGAIHTHRYTYRQTHIHTDTDTHRETVTQTKQQTRQHLLHTIIYKISYQEVRFIFRAAFALKDEIIENKQN